nr:reverse transcriptase domain-containing protein [Tanacetum cinerariifolium]
MSSSTVTYTFVHTNSEPGRVYWGADEELSNRGSEHPMSLDYVPGPDHPPLPVKVPYVPEPEHLVYLVPFEDEEPIEDQPLPTDTSPIALSLDYVTDSDLDEDSKKDPKVDHADYPADGGGGDDEPFDDDDDDDIDYEDEDPFEDEDDDEEEEHIALADSSTVPVVDHVPSAGDTKAFETDESAPTPRSPQTRTCIAEHVAAPTPPLPVSSPPLPLPSPLIASPTDAGAPLGYKTAGIRMRALLPSASHRTDVPEARMPPQKRACFTTPTPGLEVGESSAAVAARQPWPTLEADLRRYRVNDIGYGITDTWDEIVEAMMEIASTTLEGVNQKVTELATTFGDMPFNCHTVMLLDREATYARRAWTQLTAALGRIETLKARDPEPQDEPADTGSSRTTRTSPATTNTTTTIHVTDAQLKALIAQNVTAALAKRDTDRSKNGDDSHDSGTGGRRQVPIDVLEESDVVKKYVSGLPNMIHKSVKASKPKTMQEAIEFATEPMDKKILTIAERLVGYYRRFIKGFLKIAKSMTKLTQKKVKFDWGEKEEAAFQLIKVHSTFHVSNLKKCLSDEPLAISLDDIHIDDKLCFIEELVEIIDREVKRLKQSYIPIIKVQWNSRRGPEFTWEREDQFWKKLKLPQQLSRVHSTFHVSNLKKCLSDEPLAIPLDEIHIDDKLRFVEEPVEIIDREVKRLKQSYIPIIKVQWNSRRGPEFTWEREDQFWKNICNSSQKPHPRQVSHLEPCGQGSFNGGNCNNSLFQVIS